MTEGQGNFPMNPAYVAENFPVLKETLLRLGYTPEGLAWEAALRMARTPDLASDMLFYAKAGMPKPDFNKQTPKILFRPLPHRYTVASLVRDFGFEPVGAFLMASDLVAEPKKAHQLLQNFIREGYWTSTSYGNRELQFPPVATQYPRCPVCNDLLPAPGQKCQACSQDDLDEDLESADGHSEEQECPVCGSRLVTGRKFCGNCGAPVKDIILQKKPPSFCPSCGNALKPGVRFCPACGAPTG